MLIAVPDFIWIGIVQNKIKMTTDWNISNAQFTINLDSLLFPH